MNKFILSTLVLSAVAVNILAVLPNPAVSANKKPTPQNFSWINISQILFGKKPPVKPRKGGSRDPIVKKICMVSPDIADKTRIVWSDRPLFIWKGQVQKVTLRTEDSNQEWSQPVTQTQNITYTGEPLKPGRTYEWRAFFSETQFKSVTFQVMEANKRDRITAELKNLENRLKAQRANTEAIASAKANYFADSNLWSDVLQQAYSVQKPSDDLKQMIKNIDNLCN